MRRLSLVAESVDADALARGELPLAENGTLSSVGSPRRTTRSPRGTGHLAKLIVLKLDGCEQKAAAEMVAKTGAKGKFNNGCPSLLPMLADSYGRISPFSDHDRCLSSPGIFSLADTRQ